MSVLDAVAKRRLRGEILKLIRQNQEKQRHRLDDITLWGVLDRLHHDVSINQVRTLLSDLRDRDCIDCKVDKDKWTGVVSLRKIKIRPAGVDILEGTKTDPAIEVVG